MAKQGLSNILRSFLRVKNWSKYQAYKDGRPLQWIKLHTALLDDYTISQLSEAARFHLIGIWLLAGTTDNKIPDDPGWIGARIMATTDIDIEKLVSLGLIERYEPEDETVRNRTKPYEHPRPRVEKRRESREEREEGQDRSADADGTHPTPNSTGEGAETGAEQQTPPQPMPAHAKKQPKPSQASTAPKADPLAAYPKLQAKYMQILKHLRGFYPKIKQPKTDTPQELKQRQVLADLVRLDGYSESEVIDTFRWLFTDMGRDGEFWRKQVQSLGPLRHIKSDEALHKFGKVYEVARASKGKMCKPHVKSREEIDRKCSQRKWDAMQAEDEQARKAHEASKRTPAEPVAVGDIEARE